jgi:hypothetical protein
MSPVVPILLAVRERLSDPKRWVKGTQAGVRARNGVIPLWKVRNPSRHNCWCLSAAISLAVPEQPAGGDTWTELRSDVERELLLTLDEMAPGHAWTACYQFNDCAETTHADVLRLIDATLSRLQEAA